MHTIICNSSASYQQTHENNTSTYYCERQWYTVFLCMCVYMYSCVRFILRQKNFRCSRIWKHSGSSTRQTHKICREDSKLKTSLISSVDHMNLNCGVWPHVSGQFPEPFLNVNWTPLIGVPFETLFKSIRHARCSKPEPFQWHDFDRQQHFPILHHCMMI